MLKEPFPKNPEAISKEVDLTIKIKDIKEIYVLKDNIEVKWWETFLILLLFVSGIGFTTAILKIDILFEQDKRYIVKFFILWGIILIISLIAVIEFILLKFRALRKLYDFQTGILLNLQKEIDLLKNNKQSINENKLNDDSFI